MQHREEEEEEEEADSANCRLYKVVIVFEKGRTLFSVFDAFDIKLRYSNYVTQLQQFTH